MYGSPEGLSAERTQRLFMGGLEDDAAAGASFAVGDFNGDETSDLAVGQPGRQIGPNPDAGAVHVFYGSPDGLIVDPFHQEEWYQGMLQPQTDP